MHHGFWLQHFLSCPTVGEGKEAVEEGVREGNAEELMMGGGGKGGRGEATAAL